MKRSIFLLMIISFITSCGGIKDAGKVLRNEKIRTTDEFLVKKETLLFCHQALKRYLNQEQ